MARRRPSLLVRPCRNEEAVLRITRVYTRTGDGGDTGLGGGQRVPKDSPRIEAYGTVDELNSYLGVAIAACTDAEIKGELETMQHRLFDVGSDLCLLEEDKKKFNFPPFPKDEVERLEKLMDKATEELAPLEEFILPGGSPASAHLHVARCIARRAERLCVGLARMEKFSEQVVPYLNRLSDALFVLARLANKRAGQADVFWKKKRGLVDRPTGP
jgi:cob(I)alamin adenosyltransferase